MANNTCMKLIFANEPRNYQLYITWNRGLTEFAVGINLPKYWVLFSKDYTFYLLNVTTPYMYFVRVISKNND